MNRFLCAAAVAAGLALAGQAAAADFAFSITGADFSGSGTLTTDGVAGTNPYPCATCASGPNYLVTSISGTLNGFAIDGLAALGAFAGNNNLIYPTAGGPYLDWGDLGFVSHGVTFDAFQADFGNARTGYFLASSDTAGLYNHPIEFALTAVSGAVPEPAAWGLMLVGFGGVGALLRRRRSPRPSAASSGSARSA